jgi:hypothetical protein
VRRVIGIICCAAIAALLSAHAPADGARSDTRARDPGPSRDDQTPADSSRRPAADPAATPEHASGRWSGRGATRPTAGAPEAQARVYWRSDRGRVKSRAEFAPS